MQTTALRLIITETETAIIMTGTSQYTHTNTYIHTHKTHLEYTRDFWPTGGGNPHQPLSVYNETYWRYEQ